MSWIITIIVGALIGWIASAIMKTRSSLALDVIIGIVGSVIGVWFFSDVLGIGPVITPGTISLLAIIWGIIGAVVLIAVVEALIPEERRRGWMESDRRESRGVAHEYEGDYDEEITRRRRRRKDKDDL